MPKARRPPTHPAPSPAMVTSSTVAETAEPVTTSRTSQHAATPPVTAQRLRLRRRSGARTCRRTASLPSVIEYRPRSVLDSSDGLIRAGSPAPVTEDAGSKPCSQRITGSFQISGSCQGSCPWPPTSRFLEKKLNSRALDSVSPPAGMLPPRCRTKIKAGNRDCLLIGF